MKRKYLLSFYCEITTDYYFFRIPVGTSPELSDLLRSLLRRNACDRISFDTFFSHSFLQRPEPQTDLPGKLLI